MSSPSPTSTTPDLSSLSISAQLQRSHDGYDHSNYFATAPASNPYGAQQSFSDGPFNTTMGLGSKAARGGLPSHWMDQNQQSGAPLSDGRSTSPPTDLSSSGSPPPPSRYLQQQSSNIMSQGAIGGLNAGPTSTGSPDDDIIPTAIVIKNIPFSVKRETLLDIIASLSIPTPYAFNYHLDGAGAFRGLAFANFRLPADADAVVAALNGFDVQGRKLRVEYKKVLQAGEKERIEREKAIRRMRSMQLEKEKERNGSTNAYGGQPEWEDYGSPQQPQHFGGPMMNQNMMASGGLGMGHPPPREGVSSPPMRSFSSGPISNQHQSPSLLPQVPPVPQLPQQYYSPQRQPSLTPSLHLTTPSNQGLEGSHHDPQPYLHNFRSFSPPSHSSASPPLQSPTPASKSTTELDLNDPSTLDIYSRILVFKEDRLRDELAFSRSLSPKQRRVVHLVAQKLGVYHYSVGEGEDRYAVVTRIERENRTTPARHAPQTLSRAQSSYLAPNTQAGNGSPTRLTPTSSLRAKKSMPDLASLHASAPRLNSRASNGNIREGYHTISSHGRRSTPSFNGLFNGSGTNGATPSVPPVPSMPNGIDGSSASVVRQPRGPGAGGFGTRRPSEIARFGNNGTPTRDNNGGLDTRSHEPLEI